MINQLSAIRVGKLCENKSKNVPAMLKSSVNKVEGVSLGRNSAKPNVWADTAPDLATGNRYRTKLYYNSKIQPSMLEANLARRFKRCKDQDIPVGIHTKCMTNVPNVRDQGSVNVDSGNYVITEQIYPSISCNNLEESKPGGQLG